MIRIILGIVCVLFSAYAHAMVAHPENSLIVASTVFTSAVCFNNDGELVNQSECDQSAVDEGWLSTSAGSWRGGNLSGINGCGVEAVNPVASATCPFTQTFFASCTNNEYVLVHTTNTGHFWAVKANGNCDFIATPETTGLVPCLLTDAFDPVRGCYPINNQSSISVEGGYVKLETATTPVAAHCNDVTHEGRMIVDSVNNKLYICTQSGWESFSADPP